MVENFLPSMSAAMGGTPQKHVWKWLIYLHLPIRLLCPLGYGRWHARHAPPGQPHYSLLATAAAVLLTLEQLGLFGLTLFSSDDNKPTHESMFIMFIVCSMCYMLLSVLLIHNARRVVLSPLEKFSYRVKKLCFCTEVTAFVVALYFYWRHNAYCEPNVYSMFGLMEYFVIVANIGFHWTTCLDFSDFSYGLGDAFSKSDTDQWNA